MYTNWRKLKAEIVKYSSKFRESFFKNALNPLIPKTQNWSDRLSKSYSE